MNIIEAIEDENLFKPIFGDLITWQSWLVVLKALFALEMSPNEMEIYSQLTGRTTAPTERASEGWFVTGRRSGKSRIVAVIAAYLSVFVDYSKYLGPGEPGVLMVISQNRKQARVIYNYLQSIFEDIPMLAKMILRIDRESITLTNGVVLEVHPARFRSIRGFTCIGACLDEIAYWMTEDSANPDHEVIAALRPSMSTIPGAMMIGLSSPYRRAGVLFEQHREHYGKDGDTLVIQSDTRTMNPTIDPRIIKRAMQQDPESAKAEWFGQFRSDISAFVDPILLDAVIPTGLRQRRFIKGETYRAFCDPSGGSADSFTLAIGHLENELPVLDLIAERKPPFSPESVVKEFSELLKQYGVRQVTGDRYSGQFVQELFRKNSITYRVSDLNRSELYLELLPLINSGNCSLLDNQTLINQLCNLEHRTSNAGRDSIDHCRGSHDDVANSVAGVMAQLAKKHEYKMINLLSGKEITAGEQAWHSLTAGIA